MSGRATPRPRALPRRRKPSFAARIRPFWILIVLLAVLGGWGLFALAQAPWFRVEHVGIDVPLGSPVSRERVRVAAAIPPDANVWLLRTGAVARRIEAIPYVDRAAIHRGQFPQAFIEIDVTVRKPYACVTSRGRVATIDASRRVLSDGCALASVPRIAAPAAALPPAGGTIADPDLGHLLGDAQVLADASLSLRSLGRDRWGGLEAVDVTGVTIRFGEDADLARKAALVGPVRAGVGSRRTVRAIDLRAPATPTVEFR